MVIPEYKKLPFEKQLSAMKEFWKEDLERIVWLFVRAINGKGLKTWESVIEKARQDVPKSLSFFLVDGLCCDKSWLTVCHVELVARVEIFHLI